MLNLFLRIFQNQKPLVPYLLTTLEELNKSLMMRFVKPQLIAEANTSHKLMNLDLEDGANLIATEKADIGYAVKTLLKNSKCSEKEKLVFTNYFLNILITFV